MKRLSVFLVVLAVLQLALAACPGTPLAHATLPDGYCAFTWSSNVNGPRMIVTVSNGDILVLESGAAQVSVFYRSGDGQLQKAVIANAPDLNHGILVNGTYLYASSPSTVYRWHYTPGTRTNLGRAEVVIQNIPAPYHSSRTLLVDIKGNFLVQSGSGSNVDSTEYRAGIRSYNLTGRLPIDWSTGAWFAKGLRNEVGVVQDRRGQIWGVENGMDDLARNDLGGNIHNMNPGEEINLFSKPGDFYGYPYCFSQFNISVVRTPRGTQYALSQFMNDGTHTDAWCQNPANVVKPAYQLHPHTAPLQLFFYYGTAFPLAGDALVTQHGSWDSDVPVGYRVSRVHFENGMPVADTPFLAYSGPGQTGNDWPHRPVGLALTKDTDGSEVLLVTSDASNIIIGIKYNGGPNHNNAAPSHIRIQ